MSSPPMDPSGDDARAEEAAQRTPEQTVEAVVRARLSQALGGIRGMIEAAVPTIMFTVVFLLTRELRTALIVSVGAAVVLLVVRLAQRSTPQFVLNAFFGIGIGALFAWRAARGGGDADDQALAYFLPGLLINAGYAVVMAISIATRWPVVGFIVGSITDKEDPLRWHRDRALVKLCSRLTWLLLLPCLLRVLVQVPLYLGGRSGAIDASTAIAALGTAKLAMGWPLQVAALAIIVWLISRDRTPTTS